MSAGQVSDVTCDELISLMVGRRSVSYSQSGDQPELSCCASNILSRSGEFEDVPLRCTAERIVGATRPGRRGANRACAGAVRDQRGEFRLRHARRLAREVALGAEDRQGRAQCCHSRWPRTSRCPIWTRSRRSGWWSVARESELARQWIDRLGIKAQDRATRASPVRRQPAEGRIAKAGAQSGAR